MNLESVHLHLLVKSHKEFMDYITNDIEDMKSFLNDNMDILSKETYRKLYLLECRSRL